VVSLGAPFAAVAEDIGQVSEGLTARTGGFERTEAGLLFRDIRIGEGAAYSVGEDVVVDWSCYTVHRGFVVQSRLLAKGGAFEGSDAEYLRWRLGDGTVIPALDEAVLGMRAGGVRRLLVQPGKFSYPADERGRLFFNRGMGPVPSTFSGKRALDQCLTNVSGQDRSLVFDVELLQVSASGAARRGPFRAPA